MQFQTPRTTSTPPQLLMTLNSIVHSFLFRDLRIPEHTRLSASGSRSRPLSHASRWPPLRLEKLRSGDASPLPDDGILHQLRDAAQRAHARQSAVELRGEKTLEGRDVSGQANRSPSTFQHRNEDVRITRTHHPVQPPNGQPLVWRPHPRRRPGALAEKLLRNCRALGGLFGARLPSWLSCCRCLAGRLADRARPLWRRGSGRRTGGQYIRQQHDWTNGRPHVCPTIVAFSGGRERERSDRRVRPTATAS